MGARVPVLAAENSAIRTVAATAGLNMAENDEYSAQTGIMPYSAMTILLTSKWAWTSARKSSSRLLLLRGFCEPLFKEARHKFPCTPPSDNLKPHKNKFGFSKSKHARLNSVKLTNEQRLYLECT